MSAKVGDPVLFPTSIAGSLPKPSWLAEPRKLWPASAAATAIQAAVSTPISSPWDHDPTKATVTGPGLGTWNVAA